MLTGKQKRFLRAMGNEMEPILIVGKDEITDNMIKQAADALEARELIKGRVLQNCADAPKNIASGLAEATHSELVQVIGRNFLLYRKASEKPKIELP
ncbi:MULTISPECIES: ribosome assembly RNA-binding protein YhbY [Dehalobacter]|jgi:RNA-binding protein|uniref:Ribosome assembly RNA-binding protein YhbY n=2 Tax=Dehalobacter restrictus TaxID=55583 RepID=A0A857DG69_9FIRM|nr:MULTISPECIES: ribosome assembly RNA-binding protein YhbY [Dehalobacter]AHF09176.1 RNA-binding protein [Dehalobacter restrictus DSM 9455]MCG1025824.1 ribosome assembly RNA-binding protein YhbY [Dehalobacter sp.]MDJ0306486.1 ribosome assembly RNA-binding protein YhbY [Dehalobacter sp.]OCZ51321.1 RNA-binding protein [Dehalobacter sp. TeCB1]QGZ99710.1 ribosome assembly RNA-binding protein YhbY [Dehalobacter restrictus]